MIESYLIIAIYLYHITYDGLGRTGQAVRGHVAAASAESDFSLPTITDVIVCYASLPGKCDLIQPILL